ncbi:CACTIN [Cordylochernes scorpioides]|uniref:Splicing factor Cactin n=1 Tax=Cordylochernes scorpioides TaxID=51811 RepID=A0ABY6KK15_9ARAC|nr:CACTIN [Cordylochernes scorpioides]
MYQSELRDNPKYVHQISGLTTVTRRGVSKIVVLPSLRPTILREAHQKFNHPGISQLTRIISAQYFWSGMSIDIRAFVKNCNICQLSKTPKGPKYGELGELPESPMPFDLVSMDTIAGFSRYGSAKNYLHVVVDHATRFAWTFPSRSTSTTSYIQVIKKVLQSGCPKRLLTDRAPAFTSPRFRRFLISHNIQPMLTTSNHPQANGLSERLNATLTGKLRLLHLQHPRASWTMLQSKVVKAYNDTPHSVTGFPPSYLMDGSLPKELSQHLDPYPSVTESRRLALQRTKQRHKLDKIRFDKNHRSPDFEVGDLVLTKIYQHPNTGKLVPYFSGPYEIIEVISPYTVRINRPNQSQNLETEVIHVNKLKHYSEDTKYIFTPHSTNNNNSAPKSYFIYHHFPPEIFHDDYKNYPSTLSNPFNHMNPDIFLDNDEQTLTARYISTPDTTPKIDIQLEPSPTTKIVLPSSPTLNHTPQISPQLSALLINCDNAKLENRSFISKNTMARSPSSSPSPHRSSHRKKHKHHSRHRYPTPASSSPSSSDSEHHHRRHRERNKKHRNRRSPTPASSSPSSSDSEHHHRRHRERNKKHRNRRSPTPASSSPSSSDSEHHHRRHRERNKKHRNRSRSPRETSQARLERIRLEQLKEKMELKRQKDLMKQMETPEQKRLRRLAKKEAKERKKKEKMGWDEEYMGYTNTDNPFGDANLLKPFAWSKKMEKEGLASLTEEAIEKRNKNILEANKRELEKVKRRRLERERERESRDEELTRIQREKEAAQFKEWEKQEDIFHLQQAILRSKIRIEDGRAKAIDLLARYISAEEGDLTVEMNEPYIYLNGLSISDLEDLQEDIRVYKELENGRNQDYWKDLEIIAEDELHKLRKKDDQVGRRDGINPAVARDVVGIFRGRGPEELEALHAHIEAKIRAEDEGVDIGYWETLLSRLRAFMARARLRQRHQDNLHRKLLQLKKEQGVETGPLFPCAKTIDPKPSTSTQPPQAVKEDLPPPPPPPPVAPSKEPTPPMQPQPQDPPSPQPGPSTAPPDEEEMETGVTQEEAEYETGGYSPRLIPLSSLEPGTLLTDPEEDWKRLLFQRSQLLGTGKVENELTKEEQAFEREARKGMVDDEASSFSVESPLDKTYLWSDKYQPRKPRYFNRVHTGFEWNKYNQTHYDLDNPPPKIVQGYKFNIFYPDLIDKSITPQFFLEPCADNKDFAILRFHAGPPYEDIAFKIVNREWEYSYKRDYRCQFYNNIFQLWFHFKRYRYRR